MYDHSILQYIFGYNVYIWYMDMWYIHIYIYGPYVYICFFWKLVFVFWRFIQSFHLSITKVLLLRGPLLDSCLSQTNHAIESTSTSFQSWRPQGHIQDHKLECWSEFSNPFFGHWIQVLNSSKNVEVNLLKKVLIVLFHQLNAVLLHTLINKIKI